MSDTLKELNNFLEQGGTTNFYAERLKKTRSSLYENTNLRIFIEAFAETEKQLTGRDPVETMDYIYKLLSLFVTENLLVLPNKKYDI